MRPLLLLVIAATLTACDGAAGSDSPELSGSWATLAGGDSLTMDLSEGSAGVAGIALWGTDQYTVDGTHSHPDVQLALTGPFTQTRVVTLRGSFVDSGTIQATLSTPGFQDQAVTFRRGSRPAP